MTRFRMLVTTPSNARSVAALVGVLVGYGVIVVLSWAQGVAMLVWAMVTLLVTYLMHHMRDGAVVNFATMLTGRPVAVTARARERLAAGVITEDERRAARIVTVMLLAFALLAAGIELATD